MRVERFGLFEKINNERESNKASSISKEIQEYNKNSESVLIFTGSFFEARVYDDTKLVIASSLVEDVESKIELPDPIIQAQVIEETCYFLHKNGKLTTYNVIEKKIIDISVSLGNAQETLILISATAKILYGISSLNILYELFPSFKVIHQFKNYEKIKKICSGLEHTLMLNSNGDIYSMGCGLRGQLGTGEITSHDHPVLVEALCGLKIIDIGASSFQSFAVSTFADAYSFGWNKNGELGIAKDSLEKYQEVFTLPQLINIESDDERDPIKEIYCGYKHTFLKSQNGRLFAAGSNEYEQIPQYPKSNVDKFSLVSSINQNSQIYVGFHTTYFVING